MKMMKSAIINRWHSIDIMEVPIPEPEDGEALVRLTYCGICGSDIHLYNGEHPVAKPPVAMGHEMIGIVEKINTSLPVCFDVGDRVSIHGDCCGKCDLCLSGAANQCRRRGVKSSNIAGDSEYMVGHVDNIVPIPPHLSDREACLLEPFACAIRTTDRARIKTGDTVLVIGGGTIGFACAFTAREMGASRVIISTRSEFHKQMVARYGFELIDPLQQDIVETIMKMTHGNGTNVTIEASCSVNGVQTSTAVTGVEGTIVMLAVGMKPQPVFDVGSIALKELNIVGSRAHTVADMRRAAVFMDGLCKKYTLDPLITDIIPLEDIEEGYKKMAEHRSTGKILVKLHGRTERSAL